MHSKEKKQEKKIGFISITVCFEIITRAYSKQRASMRAQYQTGKKHKGVTRVCKQHLVYSMYLQIGMCKTLQCIIP